MTTPKHERGIALVIVLWVGLLVAAIAGAFILDTRTSARLTRNFLDNAEARALADGGVHLAVFELARSDAETRWRRDGRLYQRVVPGGTLEIAVEDEAGKIDLNKASEELLEGLFRSAGIDGNRTSTLVEAIDKIRKGKKLRRRPFPSSGTRSGENSSAPEAAGRSRQNNSRSGRNRRSSTRRGSIAFHSVDSLGQIPGITAELHALLRPALTVFGSNKLNYLVSPREALLAIPGVTVEAVDTFLLARSGNEANDPLDEFLFEGQARAHWRKNESKFVTVKVRAQSNNGAKFARIAVVEIAGKGDRPFMVKEWREGDAQSIRPYNPAPTETGTATGGAT